MANFENITIEKGMYRTKGGLTGALEKLEAGERKLIILRYFRDMSQSDTARALGLSQVKVSRCEKKIFEKLKGELLV